MIGEPRIDVDECESTQLLLGADDPEGTVAVADHQTAGRGRLGRSWVAPPGTAITVSVLLRPPHDRKLAQVSLLGGLAAAEAVEEELGFWRSSQIKWPNDVMVNRRKVAGVLAEALEGVVVLGIGINVNQERAKLPEGAASLRTIDGVTRDRGPILARLLELLERHYERWLEDGLEAVYDGLTARDLLRGRRVFVEGAPGFAVGISRLGGLEVELDGERRTIETGEVTFEP